MAINHKQKPFQQGISMLEIVVVLALLTTLFIYLLAMMNLSLKLAGQQKREQAAQLLAKANMEGLRNFRDGTSWSVDGLGTLTLNSPYHLTKSGSPAKWNLVAGSITAAGFTQQIIFNEVRRDAASNIVASGGAEDVNSLKATALVSWQEGKKTRQITAVGLLTNWR